MLCNCNLQTVARDTGKFGLVMMCPKTSKAERCKFAAKASGSDLKTVNNPRGGIIMLRVLLQVGYHDLIHKCEKPCVFVKFLTYRKPQETDAPSLELKKRVIEQILQQPDIAVIGPLHIAVGGEYKDEVYAFRYEVYDEVLSQLRSSILTAEGKVEIKEVPQFVHKFFRAESEQKASLSAANGSATMDGKNDGKVEEGKAEDGLATTAVSKNNAVAKITTEELLGLPPNPFGLLPGLKPFQQQGVEFILTRGGRGMICDEMGLGKTIQAIAFAQYYRQEWPVLIVCPNSVHYNWKNEIEKWCGGGANITDDGIDDDDECSSPKMNTSSSSSLVGKIKTGLKTGERIPEGTLVLIVNYDKGLSAIQGKTFNVVILDESHNIKTSTTKRCQQAVAVCKKAARVLLLSGTPTMSRANELYTQLHVVNPQLFQAEREYQVRYCNYNLNPFCGRDGQLVPDCKGHSNLHELQAILHLVMKRRTKKEVAMDLPEKFRERVFLEITPSEKRIMEQRLMEVKKNRPNFRAELEAGKAPGGGSKEEKNCMFDWAAATASAKIPAVKNYLKELIYDMKNLHGVEEKDGNRGSHKNAEEQSSSSIMRKNATTTNDKVGGEKKQLVINTDEKVLIFAHHKGMVKALQELMEDEGLDCITLDGSVTDAKKKDKEIQHFSNEKDCQFAILSIQSAGTGINFTCAHTVIFTELDWAPSQLLQCEDRVHRMGQGSECSIHYLLAKGTLDDYMWPILERKFKLTNALLQQRSNGQELVEGSTTATGKEGCVGLDGSKEQLEESNAQGIPSASFSADVQTWNRTDTKQPPTASAANVSSKDNNQLSLDKWMGGHHHSNHGGQNDHWSEHQHSLPSSDSSEVVILERKKDHGNTAEVPKKKVQTTLFAATSVQQDKSVLNTNLGNNEGGSSVNHFQTLSIQQANDVRPSTADAAANKIVPASTTLTDDRNNTISKVQSQPVDTLSSHNKRMVVPVRRTIFRAAAGITTNTTVAMQSQQPNHVPSHEETSKGGEMAVEKAKVSTVLSTRSGQRYQRDNVTLWKPTSSLLPQQTTTTVQAPSSSISDVVIASDSSKVSPITSQVAVLGNTTNKSSGSSQHSGGKRKRQECSIPLELTPKDDDKFVESQ